MTLLTTLIGTLLFAVAGPVVGCLLAGLDRIISARMQGRVGPPLLQPYYDVRKLFEKERVSVNSVEGVYVACALLFALIAGGIFYSVAFFQASGSFDVAEVLQLDHPVICTIWLVFLGVLFILTIKLRKSPFDLSMSHHAHQEIVRGMTTEMSGPTLGMVEIMHWCENVLFLGWIGMFFLWANPVSILVAIVIVLLVYFLEIWIDNNFARVKWQFMFKSAWLVALVAGGVNVAFLAFL